MADMQPAAQATEINPSQGFCIEISCLPDGTFNVSAEPLQQEAEEPAGKAAGDIKEALTAALGLYKQFSRDGMEADDQFSEGFGKGPQQGAAPVERGMRE